MPRPFFKGQRGFTLIELLAVIAILTALSNRHCVGSKANIQVVTNAASDLQGGIAFAPG